MNANPSDVDATAAKIRRYLLEHPKAADTLEGVAVWWLSGNTSRAWLSTVQGAVNKLVLSGVAVRRTLRDGTVIYERSHDTPPSTR